ncbi:hypothetical protein BGZ49_001563 [Haplosporangium sp. Z 27]|nr:hypothetical protein BGZ49_001563 [Haplosporangium sp. Z 27]
MHGGNTTATIPTTAYAQDLWILNTQTWEWTSGPDSLNGRALHTLINYQNTILSVSGFEFETSKAKAAQNGFIMVYDLDTNAWSAQFGTIQESFFKRHGVVLIVGSLAGFLVLVVLAAVATRLWRKHTGRPPLRESRLARKLTKKFTRKFNNNNNNSKPFFAGSTTSVPRKPLASSVYNNRSAATTAAHLSGMSNVYPSHNQRFSNQGQFEQHIDLSALPRVDDSGAFDRDQSSSQSNPYSSMQHVPLMSDNALENQGHELDPYRDDRGLEEKDPRRLSNTVTPNFNSSSRVSEIESISYPGQLMTGNNGPASRSG